MIKLYALDLTTYRDGQWRTDLDRLSPTRKTRALACRKDDDGMRIACAGYLLQEALCKEGITMENQIFTENQWGKPQLAGREDLHFSLSHSGLWVVCAISDTPVGVDIEQPRCTDKLARRLFPEAKNENDVLRLWTATEAYLKYLGRGLTVPLDSFSVRLGARLIIDRSSVCLHEYDLCDYHICLCTTDSKPKLEML